MPLDPNIAAIVADFRAGRIKRLAATWRLMFHARTWTEIDGWLSTDTRVS
jgi:hypothetical protein